MCPPFRGASGRRAPPGSSRPSATQPPAWQQAAVEVVQLACAAQQQVWGPAVAGCVPHQQEQQPAPQAPALWPGTAALARQVLAPPQQAAAAAWLALGQRLGVGGAVTRTTWAQQAPPHQWTSTLGRFIRDKQAAAPPQPSSGACHDPQQHQRRARVTPPQRQRRCPAAAGLCRPCS